MSLSSNAESDFDNVLLSAISDFRKAINDAIAAMMKDLDISQDDISVDPELNCTSKVTTEGKLVLKDGSEYMNKLWWIANRYLNQNAKPIVTYIDEKRAAAKQNNDLESYKKWTIILAELEMLTARTLLSAYDVNPELVNCIRETDNEHIDELITKPIAGLPWPSFEDNN